MSCGVFFCIQFVPIIGGSKMRVFPHGVELTSDDYSSLSKVRFHSLLCEYFLDKNDQNILDFQTGELWTPEDIREYYASSRRRSL
jgi:hypothetical protein